MYPDPDPFSSFAKFMAETRVVSAPKYPVQDMCMCYECGWVGKVKDAVLESDSEGWEYPTYYYHDCPNPDCWGTIEEYWSSTDALADFFLQEIHEMAEQARKSLGLSTDERVRD